MKISPLESAGCKFILVKSERDGVLQDGGRNAEQVSARTRDELETFGPFRVQQGICVKRGVGVDGQDVVWVGCRDATSIIRWVDGAGKLLTRRDLHPTLEESTLTIQFIIKTNTYQESSQRQCRDDESSTFQ